MLVAAIRVMKLELQTMSATLIAIIIGQQSRRISISTLTEWISDQMAMPRKALKASWRTADKSCRSILRLFHTTLNCVTLFPIGAGGPRDRGMGLSPVTKPEPENAED